MNDMIIFPQYWSEALVRRWKQQQFDVRVAPQVALQQPQAGRWTLPVTPLRGLYTTNRDDFLQLTQLFRLFGIQVNVAQGQGLFGSLQWQAQWQVVVDTDAVKDWQAVGSLVVQSPVLRTIPSLDQLVRQHQIEGVVLDQLKMFNALLDFNQLREDFNRYGIRTQPVATLKAGAIGADESEVGLSVIPAHEQLIATVFGEKNIWLINRFNDYGMNTMSDVTPERLQQVYRSRGIGAFKIKKIQRLLTLAGMSKPDVQFPVATSRDTRSAIRDAKLLGVSTLAELTPTVLDAAQDKKVSGSWLVKLTLQHFDEMSTAIPDWTIYTAILPMASELYATMAGKPAPKVMSLRLYALLIGCVWTLPKRKARSFIPIVKRMGKIENVQTWTLDASNTFDCVSAETLMTKADLRLDVALTETQWLRSVYAYQQLLSDSISAMIDDYWTTEVDAKVRELVYAREVTQPKPTLEELATANGLTRERIRQIVDRAGKAFSQWWDNLHLSLKLLTLTDHEPVRLEKYFTQTQTQLIMNLIIHSKHATATRLKSWVVSNDSRREQMMALLQQIVKHRFWIEDVEIHSALVAQRISTEQRELEDVMLMLGFSPVQGDGVWTKNKGVGVAEIVLKYMAQQHMQVIGTDFESFQKVSAWAKRYFHREIATSVRSYNASLGQMNQLITIGDGRLRLYQADRYPQSVFRHAKDILEQRFASSYQFARDKWLLDRVKPELPENITSDEWYHAFKRNYTDQFNYGTGRNNDIYPVDQPPLTTNQQIALVAKMHPKGYPLPKLRQDYGWELYTVSQATGYLASIYIQDNKLFWLNITAADKIIKPAMCDFFEQTFKHTDLITMQQAYEFFNDFMMDRPKVFDEVKIYNVEALSSYLATIDEIDVVGGFFILNHDGLMDLPRETGKVWLEYLRRVAAKPITEKQMFTVVHAAGTTQSTWDQMHEERMRAAQILPVSEEMVLAGRNIVHTEAVDALIRQRMQDIIDQHGYVATRALATSNYVTLPAVHNREFPEEVMVWTPELFISYAQQLGYRRLSWPKNMINTNCDVLVAKTAPDQSMQALMAKLLTQWLQTETNESNLFRQAGALGLVPDRQDATKWHFSNYFLAAQGFIVDELGNMRRQSK